jgi:hypothetical protein
MCRTEAWVRDDGEYDHFAIASVLSPPARSGYVQTALCLTVLGYTSNIGLLMTETSNAQSTTRIFEGEER